MSEWKSLSSITSKIGSGSTPRGGNSVYSDSGISFIRSQNVLDMDFSTENLAFINDNQAEKLNNVIVEKNDILLNITGDSIARCTVVPEEILPARVNQHVSIIRCKNTEESKYVMYYLQYMKKYLLQISKVGGTRNALTKEAIGKLPIKISDDCNKISKILDNIDQKIHINSQINQELEALAKTLYDYWFVQFDFPDQNGKPYKSSGGKMVYNPELKREIPEGWGVESLVDNTLSTVIKPGIDEFTQKTYLATADVVNTSIKGGRLITYDNRETRANMQPSVNSVWFAKMKSSNKHLFLSHSMKELIDSTILSTGFMGLQCKEESFEYLASFISDPDFEIFKDKLSHGATQQAVNVNDLKSILVTIPDDYTLHEFHKKVKSIFLNIGRNTVEDKYLNSLRDWLLPMLMNGQVKVE